MLAMAMIAVLAQSAHTIFRSFSSFVFRLVVLLNVVLYEFVTHFAYFESARRTVGTMMMVTQFPIDHIHHMK